MAGDDRPRIEVVYRWDDDSHPDERDIVTDALPEPHPNAVVRAGRRFRYAGWQLRSRSGRKNRLRFLYRG